MYWEDFLKQNPDINIEDLGKPAEFKPPVKPKRTTPKGPGPVDKGWAAYQNWRQEPDLEKKFGSLGKTIPAYTQTQDALKWAWNPNPDRVQQPSTQQLQRQGITKNRQFVKARASYQTKTNEDQRINSLSTKPNPGNTKQVETSNNNNLKVYNRMNFPVGIKNPIVSGSVADAQGSVADTQGWKGWEKVWNKMREDKEKGGGGGSGGNNDDNKDDKKNTDRKDKLNELSKKFETALDLTKAIWGDQTKERAHYVRMSEIDENPFSGYVA